MRCCLIQLATIFLTFQCIQGTLHDTKRSIKRRTDGIKFLKTSVHPFSRDGINDDQDVHELSKPTLATQPGLRARKQSTGTAGNPEALSSYLSDNHQYARVNYLGEGNKVIYILYIYT